MTADVVKSANRAVAIAQHQHTFSPQVEGFIVAGLGDGIDVAYDLPAGLEHALEFQPRQFRIVVNPGGQGMRQCQQTLRVSMLATARCSWIFAQGLYGYLMYSERLSGGKKAQCSK